LKSIAWADEIVIVDSGSTDRTEAISAEFKARFFLEPWQGFGAQKNSALQKCTGDWILSLDADEEVSAELAEQIQKVLARNPKESAWFLPRRNLFLGKAMRRGGYYPDRKLRLFKRGSAVFEERAVHETLEYDGITGVLSGDLIHYAYPTLNLYLEHMNRYSSLGAEIVDARGGGGSFVVGILINPIATFLYNYILRGGFVDGREGLLLHLYHSCYVSWKYAKLWERRR
jgi:glycosyltransferase involved in cell wall biosynthesis